MPHNDMKRNLCRFSLTINTINNLQMSEGLAYRRTYNQMCLIHKDVHLLSRKIRNRNHSKLQRVVIHNSELDSSASWD